MTELAARRKEFAASFGASVILDPSTDDVVARVREVTHGKGVDVGFDCAGVQIGLQVALKCIRAKGTLVNVAVWPDEARLDMFELVFRERGYIGTACYVEGEFEEVLQAMASGESFFSSLLSSFRSLAFSDSSCVGSHVHVAPL